jgi:hypothetical protein
MSMLTKLKQRFCTHMFDINELVGRPTPDGDVTWPCSKCGKVFKAHCGLDIVPRHGDMFFRGAAIP